MYSPVAVPTTTMQKLKTFSVIGVDYFDLTVFLNPDNLPSLLTITLESKVDGNPFAVEDNVFLSVSKLINVMPQVTTLILGGAMLPGLIIHINRLFPGLKTLCVESPKILHVDQILDVTQVVGFLSSLTCHSLIKLVLKFHFKYVEAIFHALGELRVGGLWIYCIVFVTIEYWILKVCAFLGIKVLVLELKNHMEINDVEDMDECETITQSVTNLGCLKRLEILLEATHRFRVYIQTFWFLKTFKTIFIHPGDGHMDRPHCFAAPKTTRCASTHRSTWLIVFVFLKLLSVLYIIQVLLLETE